jgi:sec-independent protein translocase protein TatC
VQEDQPDAGRMSFLDHLGELRTRLTRALLALALCFVISWYQSVRIFGFFVKPLQPYLGGHKLVFIEITEPFLLYMKVSLLAAVFAASPIILYQLWAFVSPGLYPREKRYAIPFIVIATMFFLCGGTFGYYVAFPYAARFLLSIAGDFEPALTVKSLFSFESKIILGMGLVFELPVAIFLLSRIGIVSPGFLLHHLKHAVLIIFIIAAIITPTPDVITQCVFALPMVGLYLLGIAAAYLVPRGDGSRG